MKNGGGAARLGWRGVKKELICGAHMSVTREREGGASQKTQLHGEDAFGPRCQGTRGPIGSAGTTVAYEGERAGVAAWGDWARFQGSFKMDLNFEFQ
jgi:hypothetical protein